MSDEQFNIHTPLKRLFDTREFPSEAAGGGPLEPTDPRPAPLPRPASSLPLRLHPPSSIRSSTPNRADRFCDVCSEPKPMFAPIVWQPPRREVCPEALLLRQSRDETLDF